MRGLRELRAAAISSDAHYLRICISRVYTRTLRGMHEYRRRRRRVFVQRITERGNFLCTSTLIDGAENYASRVRPSNCSWRRRCAVI